MRVTVLDHPLVAHKLTVLRDKNTTSPVFRLLVEELVTLLAYEATRGVRVEPVEIDTPVTRTTGVGLSKPRPLVVPILRAGLGMLEGMTRLIPTAEVPITNMFRDELLSEEQLPIACTGYTPCFRREAGSYGAHVRGLNRLHQFDKVELVRIEKPEDSYAALDAMVEQVKEILRDLKLPYRILRLCGGDLGFTSAMTYDFEVFSTAQDRWLEISSVSNFETFQANRLKLRYKSADGSKQLVHTLNGSALALPRVLAGILENYQTPQGIRIPEVLVPYTGFEVIE